MLTYITTYVDVSIEECIIYYIVLFILQRLHTTSYIEKYFLK